MHKNNPLQALILFIALASPWSGALAGPPATSQGAEATPVDGIAAQLQALQSEVMLLKARTARANALAEYARAASFAGANKQSSAPSVKSIYGRNGALMATVRLSSGITVDIKTGDTVPGGYKVGRIDREKVTFLQGNNVYEEAISADLAIPPNADVQLASPPLPGKG